MANSILGIPTPPTTSSDASVPPPPLPPPPPPPPPNAENSASNLIQKNNHQQPPLIPGLPNHIAQLCLSYLNPSLLYSVCQSWRHLIYSPSFPPFLSLYALLSDQSHHWTGIQFSSFDPVSSKWNQLPPPPPDPPIDILLHHPSFISRKIPAQSVTASGKLILLAASTRHLFPTFSCPLIFNPLSKQWVYGPPLESPRRWCAAGVLRGTVYVASGIGSQYNTDVARSVERWDLKLGNENGWEKMRMLKDGRFSRDAIDAVGYKGKLYMVNAKGVSAKEGAVYDVEKDAWEKMPEGMITGWTGPAASMDDEVIYVVDEGNGALRRYNAERVAWDEIFMSERLKGAEQIAAGGGRVCVVCGGAGEISVVDVVASPVRIWGVVTPPGFGAVAVHILPRMTM